MMEDTLNQMLDAEALVGAGRCEHTKADQDYRSGSYTRKLHTTAGEVELKTPKLRYQTFETATIERCRRREAWVETASIYCFFSLNSSL